MKLKSILSIAAFSTAFIFSAAFAGLFVDKSDSQPQIISSYDFNERTFGYDDAAVAKINRLLQKDDDNGRARDARLRRAGSDFAVPFASDSAFADYADATARYAASSSKIDQNDLSPEFKSAWNRHMKAWRDYANFLQSMKESSARSDLGEESFNDSDGEYGDEINQSWIQVLRAAQSSGADTEKYWASVY